MTRDMTAAAGPVRYRSEAHLGARRICQLRDALEMLREITDPYADGYVAGGTAGPPRRVQDSFQPNRGERR